MKTAIFVTQVYGRRMPVNDTAKAICKLANKASLPKEITEEDLNALGIKTKTVTQQQLIEHAGDLFKED